MCSAGLQTRPCRCLYCRPLGLRVPACVARAFSLPVQVFVVQALGLRVCAGLQARLSMHDLSSALRAVLADVRDHEFGRLPALARAARPIRGEPGFAGAMNQLLERVHELRFGQPPPFHEPDPPRLDRQAKGRFPETRVRCDRDPGACKVGDDFGRRAAGKNDSAPIVRLLFDRLGQMGFEKRDELFESL